MSNDTQHYTNFEIFHSLVPKMKAVSPNITNWDELDKEENYDNYSYVIDAIATAYRSGYGRGQKGRSFLIGEKKAEVKKDDNSDKPIMVCYIGKCNDYYEPKTIGTIGRLDRIDSNDDLWVFWPDGSCDVHNCPENVKTSWCVMKKDCVLIDTDAKIEVGDRVVYIGRENMTKAWPKRGSLGVVSDFKYCEKEESCFVKWDNNVEVVRCHDNTSHTWIQDIAKVIPWD